MKTKLIDARVRSRFKAADEIVNNSNVLQNDDDLFFPVGANDIWQVDVLLIINSTAVADFKHTWSLPAGGVGHHGQLLVPTGDVPLASIAATFSDGGTGADAYMRYQFTYWGGGTAGIVRLQWAQGTAQVSDTKVKAGSYISMRRIG